MSTKRKKQQFFKLISVIYKSLTDDNLFIEELFTKALFYTFSFNFAVINHFVKNILIRVKCTFTCYVYQGFRTSIFDEVHF